MPAGCDVSHSGALSSAIISGDKKSEFSYWISKKATLV